MLACRPERITLQDINFAGRDEDIYNVKLINGALTDDDMFPAGHAVHLHSIMGPCMAACMDARSPADSVFC